MFRKKNHYEWFDGIDQLDSPQLSPRETFCSLYRAFQTNIRGVTTDQAKGGQLVV